MSVTGLCVLCNVEVTEDDYRREIDCPSKSCPGRVYHEDCIAAYLKRTKYSKDRCTGFPCPATLANGKPCPGYVCKMHNFFPANAKKKQARLQAAIVAAAAASAPKPKPVPAKPKAGAQTAIAAIQRAATGGNEPVVQKIPRPPTGGTSTPPVIRGPVLPAAQQQPFIPGMDKEELRRTAAALKAEVKAGQGGNNSNRAAIANNAVGKGVGGGAVGVGKQALVKSVLSKDDRSLDEEREPRSATLWDAFMKPTGLNYFDVERQSRNGGGRFSDRLKQRLDGTTPTKKQMEGLMFDGSSSEDDSVAYVATPTMNREGSTGLASNFSDGTDADCVILTGSPNGVKTSADNENNRRVRNYFEAAADMGQQTVGDNNTMIVGTLSECEMMTNNVIPTSERVLEYDMVFAVEDGSYLVFDQVSNTYVGLEELYGPGVQLVEVAAEDGNMYLCVAVHQTQLDRRADWQQSWVQTQLNGGDADAALTDVVLTDTTQPVEQHWNQSSAALAAGMTVPFTDLYMNMMNGAGGTERRTAAVTVTTTTQQLQQHQSPSAYHLGDVATKTSAAAAPVSSGVPVEAPGGMTEDEDTDVESLMKLLCV